MSQLCESKHKRFPWFKVFKFRFILERTISILSQINQKWALWTISSAIAAPGALVLQIMYRTDILHMHTYVFIISAGPDYSEMPSAG